MQSALTGDLKLGGAKELLRRFGNHNWYRALVRSVSKTWNEWSPCLGLCGQVHLVSARSVFRIPRTVQFIPQNLRVCITLIPNEIALVRLLQEIIDLLSSSAPSLENALFKAQVLAHQLGEHELKQWVASELKGYPDRALLPPYRIIPVTVMANLSNGVVRYTDQPLPLMSVDKRLREKLETMHLTQSIAVIEEWSKRDSDLSVVVAPEYYPYIKKGIDRSFEIERAWGKHSVGAMLQVVVEVRSRLLELALEVSDRIPLEPEPERIKQVSQEVAVSEVFRNAVFGSNTTIVVGSGSI